MNEEQMIFMTAAWSWDLFLWFSVL